MAALAVALPVAAHAQAAFTQPDALSAPVASALEFNYQPGGEDRTPQLDFQAPDAWEDRRGLELELSASRNRTGAPLDVSIAHRSAFGADSEGDLSRQERGAELRMGRGERQSPDGRWYVFAGGDDEALTWQPGSRSEFGGRGSSFALQDRVEIGDRQAGITFERGNVQASLAYVERQVSATVGHESISQSENFGGLTLTMRR